MCIRDSSNIFTVFNESVCIGGDVEITGAISGGLNLTGSINTSTALDVCAPGLSVGTEGSDLLTLSATSFAVNVDAITLDTNNDLTLGVGDDFTTTVGDNMDLTVEDVFRLAVSPLGGTISDTTSTIRAIGCDMLQFRANTSTIFYSSLGFDDPELCVVDGRVCAINDFSIGGDYIGDFYAEGQMELNRPTAGGPALCIAGGIQTNIADGSGKSNRFCVAGTELWGYCEGSNADNCRVVYRNRDVCFCNVGIRMTDEADGNDYNLRICNGAVVITQA